MKNGSGPALLQTRIAWAWWLPLFLLLAIAVTVKADDFTYTMNSDGTISITRYTGSDEVIVIPASIDGKTVTSIGDSAFDECAGLTGVTIPYGVITIGGYAFQYCTNLTSMTFPASVASIGNSVFDNCISLTSVSIPTSVTNIGDKAFDKCTHLTAVSVDGGNSVYSSVAGVLFNKNQTTLIQYPPGKAGTYTIPNTVVSVGSYAFDQCAGLTGVTIPVTVASIGDYTFDNCSSLTSVTIPYSVTSIGYKAFDFCNNLTAISVDGGNSVYSSVDGVLFNKNQTALIQYPPGKAGAYAIPNTVASIGNYAFDQCAGLTGVTIPSSVTSIGDKAFDKCTSLASVTIPYRVASIGALAFDNCTHLTAISVDGGNSIYSSVDGVLFNKNQTTLIQYPPGKAGTYTIPNTVAKIGGYAFDQCAGLTGITIPYSVTSIGDNMFNNYSSLISVTIPNTVASIGDWVFSSCASLISVTIGNSVISIGDGAFSLCASLRGIYFEGNAPSLGSGVFDAGSNAIVYYLPGTIGWGQTFGGLQTVLWTNTIGPSIKANGTAKAITINYPATLSVTVTMNAGYFVGIPVDWWVAALAGPSCYYLNNSTQWIQFDGNLSNCHPMHQGALFNLPTTEVLNMTGLPIGSYTFWFIIDYPMDGILNLGGPILIDWVNVTIQ